MSSREKALGAWADKIPRVDGFAGPAPAWKEQPIPPRPRTEEGVARELRQVGVLLLMGLGVLLLAALLLVKDLDVILYGQQTSGTIVDHERGPRTYTPVVEFFVDGQPYVAVGCTSTRRPIYEIGDRVPVRYVPHDPSHVAIGGMRLHLALPTIIAMIGLFFVLLALGSGIYIRRAWAQQQAATT